MGAAIYRGHQPRADAPVVMALKQAGATIIGKTTTTVNLAAGLAQVGQRVLVVDLAEPHPDLTGLPGSRHLGSEGEGLRQRLAFDATATTAAALLAQHGEAHDHEEKQ